MKPSASALLEDSYAGGPGRRVAPDVRLISAATGLPEAEVDAVSEAAPLQDLGRSGTPGFILSKPVRLVCRHGIGADPVPNIILQAARSRYDPAIVAVIKQSLIGNALRAAQGEMS